MTDCGKRHWHGWISIVERSHTLILLNPLPLRLFEAVLCKSEIKLKIWRALTTCCAEGSPASCWVTVPTSHYWVPICYCISSQTLQPAPLSPPRLAFSAKCCSCVCVYHFLCSDVHSHPRGSGVITRGQPTPNVQLQGLWRVCHVSPTHSQHAYKERSSSADVMSLMEGFIQSGICFWSLHVRLVTSGVSVKLLRHPNNQLLCLWCGSEADQQI